MCKVSKPFPFFLSKELQKEPKTAKSFRSLRRATKGAALGACDLFEKRSIKNFDQSIPASLPFVHNLYLDKAL